MATEWGTDEYRDRPGPRSPAQPPGPAGPGRRSPHDCWVRLVLDLRGPESRQSSIAKPGRWCVVLATAAVNPGADAKKRHRSRDGELLSLDFESLMTVRRARSCRGPTTPAPRPPLPRRAGSRSPTDGRPRLRVRQPATHDPPLAISEKRRYGPSRS